MPINPSAVGLTSEPRTQTWTNRDTLLYALGIGAGVEDLAFTTENSQGLPQRVYPTFGVVVASEASLLKQVGEVDLTRLVHGSQSVRQYEPLPAHGELTVQGEVANIQDKGEGRNAVLVFIGRGTDPRTGQPVVETKTTLVIRGAGGFGGRPGEKASVMPLPDREPDVVLRQATRVDQPLIYRLSGDRNPLHSDPWFATEKAGFPGPILHGLCTYGIVGRALLGEYCANDPSRFISLDARFSAPVVPGDNLITSTWSVQDGLVLFSTTASSHGGTGRVVLDQGVFAHRA